MDALDGALKRLHAVKKRLGNAFEEEKRNLRDAKARADHLASLEACSSVEVGTHCDPYIPRPMLTLT